MASEPEPNTAEPNSNDPAALAQRVSELQEKLLQAQEKNLMLTAQVRELERSARDMDDLRVDLSAQALLLADKSKENKHVHQEFPALRACWISS